MQNKKDKVSLNPIMTLMILIGLAILLSGILALFGLYYVYPFVIKLANVKDKKINFLYLLIFTLFIIDALARIWLDNNYSM